MKVGYKDWREPYTLVDALGEVNNSLLPMRVIQINVEAPSIRIYIELGAREDIRAAYSNGWIFPGVNHAN